MQKAEHRRANALFDILPRKRWLDPRERKTARKRCAQASAYANRSPPTRHLGDRCRLPAPAATKKRFFEWDGNGQEHTVAPNSIST